MRSYSALAAAVATIALLASACSGAHRPAALIGAVAASFTAFGSLLGMARVGRSRSASVNGPLAVMTVAFLARILLVSLGVIVVTRSGQSIIGFVVAFFVPYFAFCAIEAAFVHSLRHPQGPSA